MLGKLLRLVNDCIDDILDNPTMSFSDNYRKSLHNLQNAINEVLKFW